MTATITVIGNTTADPELRFTTAGVAVASFTVASTEKVFDRKTNEWKDGRTLFMRCTAWRDLAEHTAASITKGTRVVVVGKLSTREYQTKEGEKRTSMELDIHEIGPSLRYATAVVSRANTGQRGQAQAPPAATPPNDAWATTAPGQGTPAPQEPIWDAQPYDGETPF